MKYKFRRTAWIVLVIFGISLNAFSANRRVTFFKSTVGSAGGTTLLTSLVAYWKLDEAISSGTRADSSGNGLDLTDLSANVSFTASGIINDAAVPSGNAQLKHVDTALLQVGGNQDFTIQVWFNRQGSTATLGPFVDKGTNFNLTGDEYLIYIEGANKPAFYVGNGTSNAGAVWGSAITDSSWHHLIAWYDHTAQTVNLKIDNGTTVTTSWTGGTQTTTGVFSLFSNSGTGNYYTKWLDEVGFWKRVLTSGEITSLYNSGAGLAFSNFGSTP